MKSGDTLPSLEATLTNAAGLAVDLTTAASVALHVTTMGTRTVVLNEGGVIVAPTLGQVRFDWDVDDVLPAANYLAEWEVTFNDGSVESFPNNGYFVIRVIAALA